MDITAASSCILYC